MPVPRMRFGYGGRPAAFVRLNLDSLRTCLKIPFGLVVVLALESQAKIEDEIDDEDDFRNRFCGPALLASHPRNGGWRFASMCRLCRFTTRKLR